jgi:hypothetical protein
MGQRLHTNSFHFLCQEICILTTFFLFGFAPSVTGAGFSADISTSAKSYFNPGAADSFLSRLSKLRPTGSMSLNWRNIGPRFGGFETQIQDEVYLGGMYFGFDGPLVDSVPIVAEWHMPSNGQGSIELNQLNFSYQKIKNWDFQLGKFVIPFGRYNELYRPEQYLTITQPLSMSSPQSLDLVVRANSPTPPVSVGYADIGGRTSYYPTIKNPFVPDEITFYVVNGLGEANNRLRTFSNPGNLGVPPIPGNGTNIDFGHQDNNLADNNNQKSIGARLVWALGDVRFPWPFPEGAANLKGVSLDLSGMDGQYNLEGNLNYQIYSMDWSFDYLGLNFSGQAIYSDTQFLAPIESNGNYAQCFGGNGNCPMLGESSEADYGYFIQASAPILRHPKIGKLLTGVLVYNQMYRRGPVEDLLNNQTLDGVLYPSVTALNTANGNAISAMDKYTAALNWQLSDHFWFKLEYSYWKLGGIATSAYTYSSVPGYHLTDIYQTSTSIVMAF